MIVQEIELTKILVEDRLRLDVADTADLQATLQTEVGQIQCIAVKKLEEPTTEGREYRLLAGGRRYAAHIAIKKETIFAQVYPSDLSEEDQIAIEIIENSCRQDMKWDERCDGILRLHNSYKKKAKKGGDKEEWSITKTSKSLGMDRAWTGKLIGLAESIQRFPNLRKNKGIVAALNQEARVKELLIQEELSKRAQKNIEDFPHDEEPVDFDLPESPDGLKKEPKKPTTDSQKANRISKLRKTAIQCYKSGDFFELIKAVPDETFDIVEFDPDYGIKYVGESFNSNSNKGTQELVMQDYHGIADDPATYLFYLSKSIDECLRVMKKDSWLLLWYSLQWWHQPIIDLLESKGLKFTKRPAIWFKDVDGKASQSPEIYLGPCYESFFYCRKGDARINNRGHGDVFRCKTPSNTDRIHPTEKPVPLMREIYSTFCNPKSKLLIPHTGSGNGILAALEQGIKPLAFEISKPYQERFIIKCESWEPKEEL